VKHRTQVHLKGVPIEDLELGQKVVGKVVKVSDFGAYLDVGAAALGFLHIKDYHRSREVSAGYVASPR
jgi:predicted RNA-binding protein with RPS1 domain